MKLENTEDSLQIWTEIRALIINVRQNIAVAVNAELTLLYWQIGEKLTKEVLQNERAAYGKTVVKNIANQLTQEFGQGFSEKVLRHCVQFAVVLPDFEIVSTLSRQLSWSHFREIIYLPNDLQRQFYLKMSELERWSVRRLRERKDSMLFERTAISRKPEELIQQEFDKLSTENTQSILTLFLEKLIF